MKKDKNNIEKGEVSRRDFLVGAGAVVVGGAIGAAITYPLVAGKGGEVVATTKTVSVPTTVTTTVGGGATVTSTVTSTVGGGATVTTTLPGSTKTVTATVGDGGVVEPAFEPEEYYYKDISGSGTGGEPVKIYTKNGKIVRITRVNLLDVYTEEEIEPCSWTINARGKTLKFDPRTFPPIHALAYKPRVYSNNRIRFPLKRVDWEPGGDPAKINTQNRGKSKFERISWDEAITIVANEIKRVKETYGPFAVLAIGCGGGHSESKILHKTPAHERLLSHAGGYTQEVRSPDSNEGFYWGGRHVWGDGWALLGMYPGSLNGILKDVSENTEMIVFQAADWESVQNHKGQYWTKELFWFKELGIKLVFIDPICNFTSVVHGDKWIPIHPNTDTALDLAIMYTWLQEDTYDKEYVATHTVGSEKFFPYVLGDEDGIPKTPAWASEITGIPEYTIKALAREWASKRTAIGHFCGSHIRGPYSHEPGRTEIIKLGMRGVGKPGILQMMLSNMIPAPQSASAGFSASAPRGPQPTQKISRARVADAIIDGHWESWGSTLISGCPIDDQFKKYIYPIPAAEGGSEVHMIWTEKVCNIACWNAGFYFIEACRNPKIECMVANHQWLENDCLYADIVFPITSCAEDRDLGSTGIYAGIQITYALMVDTKIKPVGEALSDYQISKLIAKELGPEVEVAFTGGWSDEEALEHAFEISALKSKGLITWDKFKEKGIYCPPILPDWEQIKPGLTPFAEDPEKNPLSTPSGKMEFYSERLAEAFPDDKERGPYPRWYIGGPKSEGWTHDETLFGERAKDYPLLLVTTPPRFRHHAQFDDCTSCREIPVGKLKGYDGYLYEPVWINTTDAAERGIQYGDIVKVFNERGIILAGAYVTERASSKSLWMGHGSKHDPITTGIDRGGTSNLITPNAPVSKNCQGFAVTGFLVEVEKLDPAEMEQWRKQYPEAFARSYDPAFGIAFDSWVEGGM